MPSFSIDYDFEVYCDTCGNGMCNQTDVVFTRNRGTPSIRVSVCDKCIGEKDNEIADLKKEIEQLEEKLAA